MSLDQDTQRFDEPWTDIPTAHPTLPLPRLDDILPQPNPSLNSAQAQSAVPVKRDWLGFLITRFFLIVLVGVILRAVIMPYLPSGTVKTVASYTDRVCYKCREPADPVVRDVALLDGGSQVAIALFGSIQVLSTTDSKLQRTIPRSGISHFAATSDGKTIVTVHDSYVGLWFTASDSISTTFTLTGVHALALSPNDTLLAIATADSVTVYRVDGSKLELSLPIRAESMAFSADGATIVTGGASVNLWRLSDGKLLHTFATEGRAAIAPDAKTVAAPAYQRTSKINLWSVEQEYTSRILVSKGLDGVVSGMTTVESISFSADGRTLLAAYAPSRVILWRVADGTLLKTEVINSSSDLRGARLMPDGKRALVWSSTDIYTWDLN